MNNVKKAIAATQNFVTDHKVAITLVTTAATTAVVARRVYGGAYKVAEEFIASKGLSDEFLSYIPSDLDV